MDHTTTSGGDEKAPSSPSDAIISDLITVTIKTIDSQNFRFQVENDMQIRAFKEKIAPTLNIEPESQRMIFCGRVLADDKTLKDYKVDNGKVIHLVKRAPPPKNDTANSGSNNQNNNQQQNERNRSRFQSFRADDGTSVLMSSFPMEPSGNIISQVMRQLFNHRTGSGSSNESNASDPTVVSTSQSGANRTGGNVTSSSANIRARFNHIRQLLSYVDTNFQVLQNPLNLPTGSQTITFSDNQSITLSDYVRCFSDVISYMDRLKPHLESWIRTLTPEEQQRSAQDISSNNDRQFNDFSIIMRIVHHLSHVFHSLTDLSVDPNNTNSPISVNVLGPSQQQRQASNVGTQSTSTASNTTDDHSASTTATSNTNQNQNNPTSETNPENTSQAQPNSNSPSPSNEFVSPPVPSGDDRLPSTTASSNDNSMFRSLGSIPGSVFVAQSPILLMELDATINGHDTNLGTRAIRNFSISDLNVTISDLINNASNVTFNSMSQNPHTNPIEPQSQRDSSNGNNTATQFSNPPLDADETSPNMSNQNSATATVTTNTTNNNDRSNSILNPLRMFSAHFDPFLNCNSIYTMPEILPTTDYNPMSFSRPLMQMFGSNATIGDITSNLQSSVLNSGGNESTILDLMRQNLVNLIQLNDSPSSNENREFFDFIDYLQRRINQLPSHAGLHLNSDDQQQPPQIQDYLSSLNLLNQNGESMLTNMLSNLFQSLNFQDLFQMINSNFRDFGRLRQPLQRAIRDNLLNGQDRTDVRADIEAMITNNHTLLTEIVANMRPATGVNHIESFRNFVRETLIKFFNKIMRSNNDETFANELTDAVKYLANAYVHFCEACFADPTNARSTMITRFMSEYADMVDQELIDFLTQIITQRINQWIATDFVKDDQLDAEIQSYIVKQTYEQQEQQPNNGIPTNSLDSMEDMEFSDAYSDMPPSTSTHLMQATSSESQHLHPPATNQISINNQEPIDWQAVVPNEWVPIIKEDIQKQKSIDNDHQPPFSDAYLNGMSKKRRLEHDQQQQQSNKQMK